MAACPYGKWPIAVNKAQSNTYYSYILKSLKDGKFYYGFTSDIEERLKYHNSGKVRSTKSRRPFILHFSEEFDSLEHARKREVFYKSIDGYNWLKAEGII